MFHQPHCQLAELSLHVAADFPLSFEYLDKGIEVFVDADGKACLFVEFVFAFGFELAAVGGGFEIDVGF